MPTAIRFPLSAEWARVVRGVTQIFLVTAVNSVTRFLHRRTFLLHFAPACVREHHA
jgi:hypothetical protein